MSLIKSRQKPVYKWQKGDLIGPREASELCGYKSPKQFQDEDRRRALGFDFTVIRQGNRMFFLRSEVDRYLTQLVDGAVSQTKQRRSDLGMAA